MGRAIFISYRRDDTEGEAGRLFDDLTRTFGENSVFMDVAGINPGLDFRKAIDENVATCGVLLAMIGPTWATLSNPSGERRLDDANDFVRLEIASALAREIAVIPVLVHDAKMPHPDQLPDNLKDLAFRNSVEITHARWNSDVQLLIKALGQYVSASSATSSEPVHATVSVQLPPANPPEHEAAPPKSKTPLIAGIAVAAVLAIAAIAFFALHGTRARAHAIDGDRNPRIVAETKPIEAPESAAAVPAPNPVAGTWINQTPTENNGLSKLQITANGNALSIRGFGKCQPVDCDWGAQAATYDGEKAAATWYFKEKGHPDKSVRVATVTLRPDNGQLNVAIVNIFPNRPTTDREFEFVKAQ